jgi:zinc transport system permease protein
VELSTLVDPLFRLPFLVGLLLAVAVPPVGCYVRLRDEWLAALALSQMAAAGALTAGLVGLPAPAGALGVAGLAALFKGRLSRAGNDVYAVGISAGWATVLLIAANVTRGDEFSHGLIDGQLYFTAWPHLAGAAALLAAAAIALTAMSRRLLVARLMPERFSANQQPVWPLNVAFDLLVAAAVAVSTMAVGVVGTFTLIFVPASVSFRVSSGWRRAVVLSAVLGAAAYLPAFGGAILLDQPFGPVFVVALLLCGGAVIAAYRLAAVRRPVAAD